VNISYIHVLYSFIGIFCKLATFSYTFITKVSKGLLLAILMEFLDEVT